MGGWPGLGKGGYALVTRLAKGRHLALQPLRFRLFSGEGGVISSYQGCRRAIWGQVRLLASSTYLVQTNADTALVCTGQHWSARVSIDLHGSVVLYMGSEGSKRVRLWTHADQCWPNIRCIR